MAKLNRDTVIAEALDLLDEVGLDAVSTRALAKRLGVEQPSLYWHFRKKEELLSAMAEAAMAPHATPPLPAPSDDWRDWFLDNTRSFRRTLLIRRDGARLHAGSFPGPASLDRIAAKMAFLTASGLPERQAQTAMLAASRFTVGSVLEEQADPDPGARAEHESAFESGLALITDGLTHRLGHQSGLGQPTREHDQPARGLGQPASGLGQPASGLGQPARG
jgi:TetR/AcrR family tetracycline transcriptional repressor